MSRIRVLMVEDHPVYRDGLRGVLHSVSTMELIGEATNGEEALRLATELKPDVILLDIRMLDIDGIVVTRRLRSRGSKVRILILTGDSDSTLLAEALDAGANGFLLKHNDREGILHAIQAVASGLTVLEGGILPQTKSKSRRSMTAVPDNLFPELSLLQREILALAAKGLTNQEIAEGRRCSVKNIQNILWLISCALKVKGREQVLQIVAQRLEGRNQQGYEETGFMS